MLWCRALREGGLALLPAPSSSHLPSLYFLHGPVQEDSCSGSLGVWEAPSSEEQRFSPLASLGSCPGLSPTPLD